jgi:hypothetical protein
MIQQTKSRPRHSNDNGLAETKNGAIIRKHMGWGHIPAAQRQMLISVQSGIVGAPDGSP